MSTNIRRILVAAIASLAAVAAASMTCGCTAPMAQAGDPSDPVTADDVVATCADLDHGAGVPDGEYTLYFGGSPLSPWTAYCHDGEEYLTLPAQHANTNAGSYTAASGSVVTTYQRIRIDPTTLFVDISDETFATTTGATSDVTSMPFAVAMACDGMDTDAQVAVDLTGTPFVIESKFVTGASASCGWNAPSATQGTPVNQVNNGWVLHLAYPQ
jgi:hypothetical protein